jgi:hypothetical protein
MPSAARIKRKRDEDMENNLKEMVQSKIEKCNSRYLLKLLTKHLATVGNIYPNLFKLLCVFETLIISTSAVESVFQGAIKCHSIGWSSTRFVFLVLI